ncbi:MAG: glycosyl hydrolase family 28 protein [Ignavibacteriales bacterium]|nr:glycosyl hydrolase family 28 protein [Ignavibacteriales bacterium]
MNLDRSKFFALCSFIFIINLSAQTTREIFVKDFGAKGDGVSLDTKAIQNAIDKCAEEGGTVFFSPGKYLTGSLVLKSNVDIYLVNGAIILGSTNLNDYIEHQPELRSYNDAFLKYSLFYAEKVKNISIRGEGIIDGQGGSFKVTTKVKPDRYKNRPFIIRFVECEQVRIENLTLQNSAMWMQQYLACNDLVIRGIKVFNHANQNNDMIDIDGCSNVIISDCIGDTDDDGIVLKSTSPHITENVVINNCIVSSHCNALKLGTESTGGFRNIAVSNIIIKPSRVKKTIFGSPTGNGGINLSTVDGGILEGVVISNINIDGPDVPIFLRLGNRARKYSESASPAGVGEFRNVSIGNVIATNIKSFGCSVTGIPNHYIENVMLNNITIVFNGGVKKEDYKTEIPELEENYPEGTMWGNLPAYGFYFRHVRGIKLINVNISFKETDQRPAIIFDDSKDVAINQLDAMVNGEANNLIGLTRSQDVFIENSVSKGSAKHFVSVSDSVSKNIFLNGNDLRNFERPFSQKVKGQVKLLNSIN